MATEPMTNAEHAARRDALMERLKHADANAEGALVMSRRFNEVCRDLLAELRDLEKAHAAQQVSS